MTFRHAEDQATIQEKSPLLNPLLATFFDRDENSLLWIQL